ncbi:MAG: mannose system component [Thermodesulfobacteriota bacterium]|nr:mannose system component [Thermodesulfobacteriota bacterium]
MKASDLAGFFLRSLFIMASLNFQRMQNLGFAFAILPLSRRMGKDEKRISSFLVRHLEYFNTHPYLSGAVLGSVIALETATGHHEQTPDISRLKKSLMGPYAAIGDSFLWGSLAGAPWPVFPPPPWPIRVIPGAHLCCCSSLIPCISGSV